MYKIVCIINNDKGISGLAHTFKEKQVNDFIIKYLYWKVNNHFRAIFGNPLKYLLITKYKISLKDTIEASDEWDILFISDQIAIDEYPPYIFTPETLVMYHRTPDFNGNTINYIRINTNICIIKKGKQGQHEPIDAGYNRLYPLTDSWQIDSGFNHEAYDKAKKDIIDWFGLNDQLNGVLECIHNSLGGLASIEKLVDLNKEINGRTIKYLVDNLPKNTETAEYYELLRKIRDLLLNEIES